MTNATELIGYWLERDHRLSLRRANGKPLPVSNEEEQAIRYWRGHEVGMLPADDQEIARNILSMWKPPVRLR